MAQWRSFKFFDAEVVKGALETLEITAACFGRSSVVFGDHEGVVRSFDRAGRAEIAKFQAYTGAVTHMKYLRTRNVLVTLGDDDSLNPTILRVWDLDRLDSSGRPTQREHRIFSAKHPPPTDAGGAQVLRTNYNADVLKKLQFLGRDENGQSIAAAIAQSGDDGSARARISPAEFRTVVVSFDVSEDLQHTAIGLTNGEIVVIKGDLERERSPKMRRIRAATTTSKLTFVGFPRTRMHAGAGANDNNSMGFARIASANDRQTSQQGTYQQLLYAVHEDATVVFRISARADYAEFPLEPAIGARPECAALNDEGVLAVAASKGTQVALFGGEQFMAEMAAAWDTSNLSARMFCEVEGDKRKVAFHRGYLVVLTQSDSRPDKFTLQCYDPESRIRALNTAQSSHTNVAWVLSDIGDLIVISQDQKSETVLQRVLKLCEVDTQAKLDQLFKKDLYDEAKKMARRLQSHDATAQQMDIQRKYGDHLYDKGKYREAIDQYMEAIGFLEPSYVIRKFLDAQRITHLTRYLEELHHERHHIANKNHTTLLLNCYTKLRDREKLSAFIRRDDIRFDAHNAIKVCRSAGYFEEATYLAERYNEPSDFVRIQLENLREPARALEFTGRQPCDVAEDILREHGKSLMARAPDDTTAVLIQMCTEWRGPPRQRRAGKEDRYGTYRSRQQRLASEARDDSKPMRRARASEFIHVFVDTPVCLLRFLEAVVQSGALDEDHMQFQQQHRADASAHDHDDHDGAPHSGVVADDGQLTVFNTLLELYLTKDLKPAIKHVDPNASLRTGSKTDGDSGISDAARAPEPIVMPTIPVPPAEKRREAALRVLEVYKGRYDPHHALALVQQARFEAGILLMLEELGLVSEVFIHFADVFENATNERDRANAKNELMKTCIGHSGSEDEQRELWIAFLSILVRSNDAVADDISAVLAHIEAKDLLPPVAVIEILAQNKSLQLNTVRDYILRMLKRDSAVAESCQTKITQLSEKTKQLKEETRELMTSATVFQSNKCAECTGVLDLPAVHFLCKHSFHQRCLNDVRECNKCAGEYARLRQVQRELDEGANDHDGFFRRVASAKDGFSVVAEQFGRGVFAAPALRKEALLMTADDAAFDGEAIDAGDLVAPAGDGDADEGGAVADDFGDDDGFGGFDDELADPEGLEAW